MRFYKKGIIFSSIVLSVFCTQFFVLAQESGVNPGETVTTNPKDRDITISLTVADDTGPTTPILVYPTNGSLITNSTPAFTWEESTDTQGMNYYILYLDGSILFNNIPLTDTSNANYTLIKNSTQYALVPTTPLTSGSHTWKIVAVDTNSHTTNSATWSFTIDNTAPIFTINGIGSTTTSISAQDLSTLPDPYVIVNENEPIIQGVTEGSSTIQITVEIPGEATQQYTITAESGGDWEHALPLLPRDEIITLHFIVTDPAGNITVLNDVYFLIPTAYLFASPTITPIPGVTTIPGEITATPTGPTPTPTESAVSLIPVIPLLPPKEIASNIINTVIPDIITENIPEFIIELAKTAAPMGTALIAVGLPAAGAVVVASQFGLGLSLQLLLRVLQAIGIVPPPEPQGLVFDSQTEKPIPFAIIQITSIDNTSITETIITNTEGVYGGISLPSGRYRIEVRHQDYSFPSSKERPTFFTFKDFYKGETFQINNESSKELFLIPLDPLKTSTTLKKISWPLIRERVIRLATLLFFPLFLVTLLITLFSTTWVNITITACYLVLAVLRLLKWFKIPSLRGKVVNDQGLALANVFVRVFVQDSNQLLALLLTDNKGQFKAFIPKGLYQVTLTKQSYIWVDNGQVLNFYQADTRQKNQVVLAVMEDATKVLNK